MLQIADFSYNTDMSIFKLFSKNNKKRKINKNRIKLGLALGGGGARGFAHLGAIKAFEEYGIKFDVISGCSIGSWVGVALASGKNFEEIYEIAAKLSFKDIKTNKIAFMPSKTDKLQEHISSTVKFKNLEDLPKKFYPVAVDLITGKEIIFEKGNIAKIVAGSCAVPGLFEPVAYDGMLLSDGGLINNIPADVPKLKGCHFVISVDVHSQRGSGTQSSKVWDVLMASIRIMHKNSCIKGYANSDILIKPETQRFKSTKVEGADSIEHMINEGYIATIKVMPQILQILEGTVAPVAVISDFFND